MGRNRLMVLAWMVGSSLTSSAFAGTFEEAIKGAYETNPKIQAQRKVLEQTNERLSQARSAFLPDISANYANGRQRNAYNTKNWSTSDLETKELNVSQSIFNGGTNIYNYRSSEKRVLSDRAGLDSVEQSVLMDGIKAYMDVVQNQAVLELSQNNSEVLEKQLKASRDRFAVGDVTRTDVAQSEARVARSKSDVIQAKGDLEIAMANFERVVGHKPEGTLTMPDYYPQLPKSIEDAIERAIENNPNLQSVKHDKGAAEDNVNATIGTLLPQLSLIGSMKREDGAGVKGADQFDTDSLKLNVSIPLYRTGAEYSRVRSAELVAKQQDFKVLDSNHETRENMIRTWENLQTATATIESQEHVIEAAQIALDGVKQENQYGSRTVLDVLDAEQELFTARVNLVRAQHNRAVAFYNVLLVLGDLNFGTLRIDAPQYDPKEHYNSVKWKMIGF